jgi:hypothetical protein
MLKVFFGIRSVISYPFRVLAYIFGLPNTKIVYKSGHVEYYCFFEIDIKWDRNEGNVTEMKWETLSIKRPIHMHIHEIESVVKIY